MENSTSTQTSTQTTNADAARGIEKIAIAGSITVDSVKKGMYDGDKEETAQLRQVVTLKSKYPKKQIANSHQDNVFGVEDFGYESLEFENKENRVTWINVPQGSTPVQVAAKLEAFPNARLYRVLSNRPILTDSQKYAIDNKITTIGVFAASQAVRVPENDETKENGTAGKLALDPSGKIQYRAIFFSKDGKADQDNRKADPADYYATNELEAEFKAMTSDSSVADVVEDQKM